MKEKLIGHTIPVEPQIDPAFSVFVQQINDSRSASILTQYRQEVIQTFLASNEKSLRVLRHACRDLSRLLEVLTPEHLANEEAVKELIPLFTAMDIGIRTNSIGEQDLKNRSTGRMMDDYLGARGGESTTKVSPITEFERRYSNVNFRTDLFKDDLLIEMLLSGIYDEANIRESLAQSSHFLKPEQQAPWKTVIKFDLLEDSIVEKALEDMQQQIAGEETLEPGEILHVFSLLLLMSFNGTCQQTFSDVVAQAKSYIDSLSTSGNLSPTANSDRDQGGLYESYDGHGYWVREEYRSEFDDIYDYLLDARRNMLKILLPQWAGELLKLVRDDPQRFHELVVNSHDGDRPYANIPVLSTIPPQDFMDAWLCGSKERQRWVSWALGRRYEWGFRSESLRAERCWALSLCKLLEGKASNLGGYKGMRVSRLIPKVLRELSQGEKRERGLRLTMLRKRPPS